MAMDEWIRSESLSLIRTEEWYKFAPEEPDGFKSFLLGIYDFDGLETVVVSEAAFALMHDRQGPEGDEEGEWVLVGYEKVRDSLTEKGWGRV